MKKIIKLALKELDKSMLVLEPEQTYKLKGGDGSDFPYYCPGEAYCYGGTGGAAERALAEVGICELGGGINSDRIMEYFNSCYGNFNDTNNWCSAFVNSMFQSAGLQGTHDALATSWLDWGISTSTPQVGDVAVATDGSHVGIVTSIENGSVMITYGNSGTGCVKTASYGEFIYRTGGN